MVRLVFGPCPWHRSNSPRYGLGVGCVGLTGRQTSSLSPRTSYVATAIHPLDRERVLRLDRGSGAAVALASVRRQDCEFRVRRLVGAQLPWLQAELVEEMAGSRAKQKKEGQQAWSRSPGAARVLACVAIWQSDRAESSFGGAVQRRRARRKKLRHDSMSPPALPSPRLSPLRNCLQTEEPVSALRNRPGRAATRKCRSADSPRPVCAVADPLRSGLPSASSYETGSHSPPASIPSYLTPDSSRANSFDRAGSPHSHVHSVGSNPFRDPSLDLEWVRGTSFENDAHSLLSSAASESANENGGYRPSPGERRPSEVQRELSSAVADELPRISEDSLSPREYTPPPAKTPSSGKKTGLLHQFRTGPSSPVPRGHKLFCGQPSSRTIC